MKASSPLRATALVALGVGLALSLLSGAASAQAGGNSREQEQIRRLRDQVRQLQEEQSTLQSAAQQAQAQAAKEKGDAAKAVEDALRKARPKKDKGTSRRLKALTTEVATLSEDKTRLAEQVTQLQKQLEEAQAQSKQQQVAAARTVADWQSKHQQQMQANDACRTQNAQLYSLGMDLLNRYENKGWGQVMTQNEPFVQTARVRLENFKAELSDKLDAARLKPAAATAVQP